jgi:hypothetical protein
MKKLIIAIAAIAVTAAVATDSRASGYCNGPLCQPPPAVQAGGLFHKLFVKQPLPAFQAAPWYLYWPYNAHFMTPAPLNGAYYAPPTGPIANPFFPNHGGFGSPLGFPHP